MSQSNPYQSPQVVQSKSEQAVPPKQIQGVWSDGQHLVMAKNATLPDVCVATNGKPASRINRSFYWHHPALYFTILVGILIFVILAMILRKSHKLEIPLSETALKKRKSGLMKCWAVGGILVLLIVGAFYLLISQAMGPNNSGFAVILLIVSFVGLVITAVVGGRYASVLKPKKITDQFSWFRGAAPEYLARLPALPPNVS